jgi:hypothetical protein
MTYENWNEYINNTDNEEVSVIAGPEDIVTEMDGVLFLCQTINGYNNIVCLRIKENKTSIIDTFFNYTMQLYRCNNIQYIRIECSRNRYKFLDRFFPKKAVVKEDVEGRDVYYCHLKECEPIIVKYFLKKTETKYYALQKHYNETGDQKDFEEMFFIMQFAIENSIKKKLKGITRTDIYDLTMDATVNVMARYRADQKYNIQYLLTAAHYAALGILYNKKTKQADQTTSYESLLDSQLLEENHYE